ncbi:MULTISPECIES: hypothetical protein [unclassified Streptomyces]|uniref:hypothetical protein n=1 Tax=unclassified Streptomyces TaxID=2593676 RepID=UPI002E32243B|nr:MULTISPECIES: hypothetical protein [unclassified Streptomyces]WUC66473.1 hypothetical protein OG861_20850 [Streptomyces sp. NBC_00539]
MEQDNPHPAQGEGCLVGALRIPVKIVAVLIVLPVRVVCELLAALGRGLVRYVLAPLWTYVLEPVARAVGWVVATLLKLVFVWPWAALWRYVLRPVGAWVYAYLLAPAGRLLYAFLLRPLAVLTWQYVLVPVGRALVWLAVTAYRYLLLPLYRYVLTPVGQALAWAWHVAGRITGALWRAAKWVGWVLVGWPLSQVYRYVLTPAWHLLRAVWRTVRDTVREARAEVRRALFGTPPREPARSRARTLGSTTAADAAPADEISLRQRQG